MKFVDRTDKTARLKDALSRDKSSLVVVYGRRRLGKSTLIKRALSDNDVYFLADRSEGQHQRTLLAKVITLLFPDFDKLTYTDWESMFRAVKYSIYLMRIACIASAKKQRQSLFLSLFSNLTLI